MKFRIPIPTRRPHPTATRARRGNRSSVVRWLLWTPRRALTIVGVALLAVTLGAGVGISWLSYKSQLSSWEAQRDANTTSTASPSGSSTDRVIDAAAQSTARLFLTAWLAGRTAPDPTVWVSSLNPFAAPTVLTLVKDTDRTRIPDATVQDVTGPVDATRAALVAVLSDKTRLSVTVARKDAASPWLVTDFRPYGT